EENMGQRRYLHSSRLGRSARDPRSLSEQSRSCPRTSPLAAVRIPSVRGRHDGALLRAAETHARTVFPRQRVNPHRPVAGKASEIDAHPQAVGHRTEEAEEPTSADRPESRAAAAQKNRSREETFSELQQASK